MFVAAQRGDARSFADFVEHWDPHLRPFVHLSLCEPESTDRVLQAAYLRAYRAMPRYRADQTPGQWLHRHAYSAVVDEVRRAARLRHRNARTDEDASGDLPTTLDVDEETVDTGPTAVLGALPLDQRAIVVMVDRAGYLVEAIADTFATPPAAVSTQLVAARSFLARQASDPKAARALAPSPRQQAQSESNPAGVLGGLTRSSSPAPPPSTSSDVRPVARPPKAGPPPRKDRIDPFAVPAWMADESVNILATNPSGPTPHDPTPAAPSAAGLLRALDVPPADRSFWNGLGQLLLAELNRPAAAVPPTGVPGAGRRTTLRPAATHGTNVAPSATSDPAANTRTFSSQAEAGNPANVALADPVRSEARPSPVATIAERAERTRPPRQWGVPLAIIGTAIAVVAAVVGAIAIGVSDPIRDGSTSSPVVAARLAQTFSQAEYLTASAKVDRPNADLEVSEYAITLAADGSWAASRRDAIDLATYDASRATTRRIAAIDVGEGKAPAVLAAEQSGLSGGPPDVTPSVPEAIDVMSQIGPLLRAEPDLKINQGSDGGTDTWTFSRTVGTGDDGMAEQWSVVMRRSDGLPIVVERRNGTALVSRVSYSSWEPQSEVPEDAFRPALPSNGSPQSSDGGFLATDLAGVSLLGRGEAITPTWLPKGFVFSSVSVRAEPLDEATAGVDNPPSTSVASVVYRRGPDRVTVSTRDAQGRASEWVDPFPRVPRSTVATTVLGDGRFNQASVEIATAPLGYAHLWGVAEDRVFTVGGDITADEAKRVANSLR